jgi:hypothetical protein
MYQQPFLPSLRCVHKLTREAFVDENGSITLCRFHGLANKFCVGVAGKLVLDTAVGNGLRLADGTGFAPRQKQQIGRLLSCFAGNCVGEAALWLDGNLPNYQC